MLKVWSSLPVVSMITGSLIFLRTPVAIRYWWNLGSLLGILMVIQIFTGWMLTFFYCNESTLRFDSVWSMHLESWNGRLLHLVHLNFASFIFLIAYFHLLKGLYFQRWKTNKRVWLSGLVILVLLMGISFLGYVLPFGQMSLWGATVITNLISVIRKRLVIWIWGGYSVNSMTLKFFFYFAFYFAISFIIFNFGSFSGIAFFRFNWKEFKNSFLTLLRL